MMAAARATDPDQAFRLSFKLTLAAQAAAGAVFGLAPLLATAAYASALGFNGDLPLVYRLGGAATLGYFVAPVIALAWRASWRQIRIPAIATLTFTIGAFAASAWELATGAKQPVILFVVAAGAIFTVIAAYWLWRDEAPDIDPGQALSTPARGIFIVAIVSAAIFGLLPLLMPGPFFSLFGLDGADTWVYRLAGAGCLGYATGGIASLAASGYRMMRIQVMAAIAFNAISAVVCWIAVIQGGRDLLAPVVFAVAASFFTIALIWVDRTHAS